MAFLPSGTQYEIQGFGYTAVVTSVGASLRQLQYRGRDLVVSFDAEELRPHYRGAILAPWPNRIVNGRYRFHGIEYQLPLTEPARGHALHGLALWLESAVVDHSSSRVELAMSIEPQTGYPFRVQLTVSYQVEETGLHVNVAATNLSSREVPFATAPHPYLVAGAGRLDEWILTLPATEVLSVSPDRLIPMTLNPVDKYENGVFDFRRARQVGSTRIDHAFTGLSRDAEGLATVTIIDRSDNGVLMSWGRTSPWVQIHTADLPDQMMNRLGLAVEPMTAPPNAFNSGIDHLCIAPGERFSVGWNISAVGPDARGHVSAK